MDAVVSTYVDVSRSLVGRRGFFSFSHVQGGVTTGSHEFCAPQNDVWGVVK